MTKRELKKMSNKQLINALLKVTTRPPANESFTKLNAEFTACSSVRTRTLKTVSSVITGLNHELKKGRPSKPELRKLVEQLTTV